MNCAARHTYRSFPLRSGHVTHLSHSSPQLPRSTCILPNTSLPPAVVHPLALPPIAHPIPLPRAPNVARQPSDARGPPSPRSVRVLRLLCRPFPTPSPRLAPPPVRRPIRHSARPPPPAGGMGRRRGRPSGRTTCRNRLISINAMRSPLPRPRSRHFTSAPKQPVFRLCRRHFPPSVARSKSMDAQSKLLYDYLYRL